MNNLKNISIFLAKIIVYVLALYLFGYFFSPAVDDANVLLSCLICLVYLTFVLCLAHKKDRSKTKWFLISFFLTPLAGFSIVFFDESFD